MQHLFFILVCVIHTGWGKASDTLGSTSNITLETSNDVPKSTVLYHPKSVGGNPSEVSYVSSLQAQESRPHGHRQSYSYAATQKPVSYHESYNSPPYYHETNNPPQSYHHEYHSPPSSYSVGYNERPRSRRLREFSCRNIWQRRNG